MTDERMIEHGMTIQETDRDGVPHFTPGPWEFRYLGEMAGTKMYFIHDNGNVGLSACADNEADINLIAAAPELYEALELDIRFFGSIANDERWEGTGIANLCNGYATRRRELLAKARGTQ